MKKTMKKMLGLTIASSLTVGMLVACGDGAVEDNADKSSQASGSAVEDNADKSSQASSSSDEQSKDYEYKTGMTLTLSGAQGSTDDWQETDLIAEMQRRFDLSIDCQPVSSDAWDTKLSLAIVEDDLADFYTAISIDLAEIGKYGAEGYLLPLNEYMEHMPNLAAFFKEHPDYEDACTSADGNIYTVLEYKENHFSLLPCNFIKTTWLENLGLEMPTSVDQLYDVLKAFKEKDANGNGDATDEIPIIFSDSYSRLVQHTILAAYDIYVNSNTAKPYGILEVDDNGKVYLADATENYKAYLTYMNKLWEEQLLYNESYSIQIADVRDLVSQDRVGVFGDANPIVGYGSTVDASFNQYFGWFAGLTSEYNDTPSMPIGNAIGNKGKLMISANTEYPEEICRMIDWFFTDEGYIWAQQADIDVYNPVYEEVVFKGYEEYPVQNLVSDPPAGYETWETHRVKKRVINGGFYYLSKIAEGSGEYAATNGSQKDEDLWQLVLNGTGNVPFRTLMQMRLDEIELKNGYPLVLYGDDVASDRTSLSTDIVTYCQSATSQFITGEVDIETGWADYIATLEKMGLSKWLQIEQEAYDAMYK